MVIEDIDDTVSQIFEIYELKISEKNVNSESYLCINDYIAFPVNKYNKYTSDGELDIPIQLDNINIGYLCLTTQINDIDNLEELSIPELVAYIYSVDKSTFITKIFTKFVCDYVVIDKNFVEDYIKYMHLSSFWGGYIHISDNINISRNFYSNNNINIVKSCSVRTDRHKNALLLAASSTFSIHRFLHLYHFLELDYDYEIVHKIKELDENNPKGLWDILNHQISDMDRIEDILSDFNNISKLEILLAKVKKHAKIAKKIFYTYGKSKNPLKDEHSFDEYFLNSKYVAYDEFHKLESIHHLQQIANTEDKYRSYLIKIASYWIYRVRCCIAHNKLGEYHIENDEDLAFLEDFAEPLLWEMVRFRIEK